MKQAEIQKSEVKSRYLAMMVICFLYGGYALIIFLVNVYTAFWRHQSFTTYLQPGPEQQLNRLAGDDFNRSRMFIPRQFDPIVSISSPVSLTLLASGIVSIMAGLTIWNLIRKKVVQAIKEEAADYLLLPDERKIIGVLKRSEYEATQKKLSAETGLNRVQVHRVVKKLEAKGLLEKHDYGMTNKIILKKEFFE